MRTQGDSQDLHVGGSNIEFDESAQRKVFTTPVHNEADDVSVINIIPKVRGLNRNRGCAAVSIGENVIKANDVHGQRMLQLRAAFA